MKSHGASHLWHFSWCDLDPPSLRANCEPCALAVRMSSDFVAGGNSWVWSAASSSWRTIVPCENTCETTWAILRKCSALSGLASWCPFNIFYQLYIYIASVQTQRYHALVSNCQHLQTKVHIVIVDLNMAQVVHLSQQVHRVLSCQRHAKERWTLMKWRHSHPPVNRTWSKVRTGCIKVGHLGVDEPLHTVVFVPWKWTKRNMCDFDWFWEAFCQKELVRIYDSHWLLILHLYYSIQFLLKFATAPQWWCHWWPITFTLCCLRSGNHSCFWVSHRLRQPWLTTLAG